MTARIQNIQTAFVSTGDPSTVDDATALNPLGSVYAVPGGQTIAGFNSALAPRLFQYVKLTAGTPSAGKYAVWSDELNYVVDCATTKTSALRNRGAGFLQGTKPTAGNFGFIQVGGPAMVFVENGSTPAVGQEIIWGTTTDGRIDLSALGTAPISSRYGAFITLKAASFGGVTLATDVCGATISPPRVGW